MAVIYPHNLMSDTNTPDKPDSTPPENSAAAPTRGYFNKEQLDDIDLAAAILKSARVYPAEMAEQDITGEFLTGFAETIAEGRTRAAESGQQTDESRQATAAATQAGRALLAGLRKIQSAAKQKHQMLAADGDPSTNFPLDGYLIGIRIIATRSIFIQSATTLILRAKADQLPGLKTPEKIAAIELLLATYEEEKGDQTDAGKEKELARLGRDELIDLINIQRAAVQHAADAIWPHPDPNHGPIRKTFAIPLGRSMGL
jgi:hypothetical protein